jgi:hypothetical protein
MSIWRWFLSLFSKNFSKKALDEERRSPASNSATGGPQRTRGGEALADPLLIGRYKPEERHRT